MIEAPKREHTEAWSTGGIMGTILRKGNSKVTASMLVMGLGQLLCRQWGKGLLFREVQLGYLTYLATVLCR